MIGESLEEIPLKYILIICVYGLNLALGYKSVFDTSNFKLGITPNFEQKVLKGHWFPHRTDSQTACVLERTRRVALCLVHGHSFPSSLMMVLPLTSIY